MSARPSAVSRCFAATDESIESCARMAYTIGHASPKRPPGTGILLRAIVGHSALRLVDIGIAPRDARVSFFIGDVNPPCEWVLVSGRQEPEDFTIACARGCALIVQWLRQEHWDDRALFAVMLAIVMPEPAIRYQIERWPVEAFVYRYRLAPQFVTQRLAMFHRPSALESSVTAGESGTIPLVTQPNR